MAFSDYELHDLVVNAVRAGLIERGSAAYGVALLCIDRGYESLSAPQKAIYDRHVQPNIERAAHEVEIEDRRRGMPD